MKDERLSLLMRQRDVSGLQWYHALAMVDEVAGSRFGGRFGSFAHEVSSDPFPEGHKNHGLAQSQAIVTRESLKLLTQAIEGKVDESLESAQAFQAQRPSLLWGATTEEAEELMFQTRAAYDALYHECFLNFRESDASGARNRESVLGMLREVRIQIAHQAKLDKSKRFRISREEFLKAWDHLRRRSSHLVPPDFRPAS